MRLGKLAIGVACVALTFAAPESRAATTTTTMAVSATVLSVCTVAATPLAFGPYGTTVIAATATLTIVCTLAAPYNVGLSAGLTAGATVSSRRMTNGTSDLTYTLSSDAAHLTNIGVTVGTDTIPGIGIGVAQTITVYGQLPAGQNVSPGVYTDTVTVTVTY